MNWALYGKRRHGSVVYTHAILGKWLNRPSKDLRKTIQSRSTQNLSSATATLSDHVSQQDVRKGGAVVCIGNKSQSETPPIHYFNPITLPYSIHPSTRLTYHLKRCLVDAQSNNLKLMSLFFAATSMRRRLPFTSAHHISKCSTATSCQCLLEYNDQSPLRGLGEACHAILGWCITLPVVASQTEGRRRKE